MGRFVNTENGVVVNVDDAKDERFESSLWKAEAAPAPKKDTPKSASNK